MERYKNLGGDSNVVAYEIEDESITVQFRNGWKYLYNHQRPGAVSVERLKSYAIDNK